MLGGPKKKKACMKGLHLMQNNVSIKEAYKSKKEESLHERLAFGITMCPTKKHTNPKRIVSALIQRRR